MPGQPQHVVLRTLPGKYAFVDDSDYGFFAESLRIYAREFELAIHAWVLMPDKMQLLVTPANTSSLSLAIQATGRRYSPMFNRRRGTHGTPWDGRFRATVIEPGRYLLLAMRLMEVEPVRAGLVSAPADYRWSSYHHHAGLAHDPKVTDHAMFWALGNEPFERHRAWQQLCSEPLDEREVAALMNATMKGWVLGDATYPGMGCRCGQPPDYTTAPWPSPQVPRFTRTPARQFHLLAT